VHEEVERHLFEEDHAQGYRLIAKVQSQLPVALVLPTIVPLTLFPLSLNWLAPVTILTGAIPLWTAWKTRSPRSRTGLHDEPLPPDAYAVRVRLVRGTKYLGTDEGTLSFVDGWMLFDGIRSTFSVPASGIVSTEDSSSTGILMGSRIVVVMRDDGQTVKVGIWPMDTGSIDGLAYSLARFRRQGAEPDGQPLLPPRSEHPSVIQMRRQVLGPATQSAALITVCNAIYIGQGIYAGIVLDFWGFAIFACIMGWQSVYAWSSIRSLRAALAEERQGV
jgi:hypothetical protein